MISVSYTHLDVYKRQLVGWQMLKEENAELLINGKRVESDYTFTADSETMKAEVAFTLSLIHILPETICTALISPQHQLQESTIFPSFLRHTVVSIAMCI